MTDAGVIWNPENPALKPFKSAVLVVCLEGRPVTEEYECFVTNYESGDFLGEAGYGMESRQYKALEEVGGKLSGILQYEKDVVFLADFAPKTLYPYLVVSKLNANNRYHLCAMSPWSFERQNRRDAYNVMLRDLSAARSLLYIDSNVVLAQVGKEDTFPELLQTVSDQYSALLPRILDGVQQMGEEKSYFDFASMSYVPVREGFNSIEPSLKSRNVDFDAIEALPPRPDGKEICDFLRRQRIKLAEANGIEFESPECPSVGPCGGTCEKCDQESRYLKQQMEKIPKDKQVYPRFSAEEMG